MTVSVAVSETVCPDCGGQHDGLEHDHYADPLATTSSQSGESELIVERAEQVDGDAFQAPGATSSDGALETAATAETVGGACPGCGCSHDGHDHGGINSLQDLIDAGLIDPSYFEGTDTSETAATAVGSVAATGTNYIDSLVWGQRWSSAPATTTDITYSFNSSAFTIGGATAGWTNAERQIVRDALDVIDNYIDVTFTELADDADPGLGLGIGEKAANLKLNMLTQTAMDAAFNPGVIGNSSTPQPGNDFFTASEWFVSNGAPGWDQVNFSAGDYAFWLVLHELGHALGLAHPFDTGGNSGTVGSPYNHNRFTVMSYNQDGGLGAAQGHAGTLMPGDIEALQYIYGANSTNNAGDDTYDLTSAVSAGTAQFATIWDTGGTDTISAASAVSAVTIDLNVTTGALSGFGDFGQSGLTGSFGTGGFMIANGSVVENATGGSGNDSLIGNAANNVLIGGAGADALNGGGGNNTASYATAGAGVVASLLAGGGSAGDANGDTFVSIQNLTGSNFVDTLTGDGNNNILRGGGANDILDGGGGTGDIAVYGGNFADYRIFGDITSLTVQGGTDGTDTLSNIESLQFADQTVTLAALAANAAPVITQSATTTLVEYSTVDFTTLFSLVDADIGDNVEHYWVWDSTPYDSGSLYINGGIQAAASQLVISAADMANTTFRAGINGSVNQFWVSAFDGTEYSAWTSFSVTSTDNARPVVSTAATSVHTGQTVNFNTLFSINDADGHAITQYQVWDSTPWGSGNLSINGVVQAPVQQLTISAADMLLTTFRGGEAGLDNQFWVRGHDGLEWGDWLSFNVGATTNTGTPVVSASAVTSIQSGQTLDFDTMFSVVDPDGDPIVSYQVWDSTPYGTGNLSINSVVQPDVTELTISAADMALTTFTGGVVGVDNQFWVRASDGVSYGNWTTFNIGTTNAVQISTITGTSGADTLVGTAGNDLIDGLEGDDFLTGGLGSDTFWFKPNTGEDTVTDFVLNEDTILLQGLQLAAANGVQEAHVDGDGILDTVLTFDDGGIVNLLGVNSVPDPNDLFT